MLKGHRRLRSGAWAVIVTLAFSLGLTPVATATEVEIRRICTIPGDPKTCYTIIIYHAESAAPVVPVLDEDATEDPHSDVPMAPFNPIFAMCNWRVYSPAPVAADARWGGQDPGTHTLLWRTCDEEVEYTVIASGAAIPPPDPAVVAQMAMSMLTITDPNPHFGPDPIQAVNRWTYLWVDDPGAITATATLAGVTVTATATLTSVKWSMGEPANVQKPINTVAPFTCEGPGIDPGPTADANIDSPKVTGTCAYIYQWRSLPERTGGSGTWNVTADSTWTVNWTSNVGVTGTDSLFGQSTTALSVGEWRSELIVDVPR